MKKTILAVGLLATAVGLAPTASATPTDDRYLTAVDAANITFPDDATAIDAGHETCDLIPEYLAEYGTTDGWSYLVNDIIDMSDLDYDRAVRLVGISVGNYCPNHIKDLAPGRMAR